MWRWSIDVARRGFLGLALVAFSAAATDKPEPAPRCGPQVAASLPPALASGVLDAVPFHLSVVDSQGIIVAVNAAWKRFADGQGLKLPNYGVGYSYLEACECHPTRPPHEGERVAAWVREILSGGRDGFHALYPCHSPDERRWFIAHGSSLEHEGARYAVVTHENVTERMLLQERLFAQRSAATLGRLTGGIAHRFNNLMTAVSGYAEMVRAMTGEDSPTSPMIEEIIKSSQRVIDLVALMQRLTPAYRAMGEIDLAKELENWRQIYSGLPMHVTLAVESEAGLPLVALSPVDLNVVLIHLVDNAVRALGAKEGEILVRAKAVTLDEAAAAPLYLPPGRYAQLSVRDNGPGIPPELLTRLYEPFFRDTAESPHTGFGLSIVAAVTRAAGGAVQADSAPGAGTTIRLYFPAAR